MSGVQPSTSGGSVNRGGTTLTTGRVGFVKCLRQTMLMPGESIRARVSGSVKMEMLRERDALRLHAHMAHFMTPVRWLSPNWTDYVREGPQTAVTIPTRSTLPAYYGLGGDQPADIQEYRVNNLFRIYNEWYKWPEDPDAVEGDDLFAVNLDHSWTRCRNKFEPDDAEDKTVDAGTSFTIADLAETQARYQSAMNRDVLSFGRYQEIMQDMWNTDGSREVDQVPVMLGSSEVGVNPRSLPATDAAGLGQWASIYDFKVDDQFNVTAPEHMILCSMLVVRFAPISEERHPLANPRLSWAETVGDPYLLAAMQPQPVELRDILDTSSTEQLGYLPAGWQWRAENNDIGEFIDSRDSFPYMQVPTNAAEARNASLRTSAFRSQALEDYVADLYFNYKSTSLIAPEMSSYTVGMQRGGSKKPYSNVRKVK